MAMLKHQLASSQALTIKEKIKLLDAKAELQTASRSITHWETAVAKIIKTEASIRKEYEHFKGNVKRTERDNFIR